MNTLSDSKKELLARLLRGKTCADKIPKRHPSNTAPLSFAQMRLWLLEELNPGSSTYNMHDAVRIRGNIDALLLKQALTTLVLRHETLRTSFIYEQDQVVQKIEAPYEIDLPIEYALSEERAKEIAKEETIRPFNLKIGPLFRARLIQIAPQDHILLWTMHHIISDGWSLGIIIKEVVALIQDKQLPPLPIQYGDFAVWQKELLSKEVLEKQLAYWEKELKGNFPPLSLPFDFNRPAVLANKGNRITELYSPSLMQELTILSKRQETTLFMTLLAAWKVLLYRYSGMNTIFVGTPVAGRNHAELADLIGFFANTIVIRSDIQGNQTFTELLQQVKTKSLAAYQYQETPFEKLVEVLQPKREINTSPFFQVMFVLQNQPMPKVDEPGLSIEPIEIHNGTCKFDLLLNIYENEVGIEYNTELFSQYTIKRMLEHYRIVLETIVDNPQLSILEIPLLSEKERNKILFEWNQTQVDFDLTKTISQYIEEQTAKTPLKIAICNENASLTYEELNTRANELAKTLHDGLIAVHMQRSVEQVVFLLAILKAGGAFLPLDPEYPEERIKAMQQDGETPHVDDLAYVIYTSGSTGRPNGAMNTHKGICNRLLWMQKEYALKPQDKVLQKTSCSFDVSVWEFFWPLMVGAELVLAPPGIHRDPHALALYIQQHAITTIHFVPSMLSLFLPQVSKCPSLRLVFCSGEALPHELAHRFMRESAATLHNLYGPTEACIDVTYWDCSQKTQKNVIPIGRPIANTQIYILDSRMEPVPIGVTGEIYIGGVGVGLGYLNRSELTAQKFFANPFIPGGRLYKTGDLARFWENGEIEFLGRVDDQVKIRGVRVELGEIEQALLEYPGVQAAAASLQNDLLTAYVVSSHNRAQEAGRIGHWQTVFETTYDTAKANDIAGWNSSYTGQLLSHEEMEDWVKDKIENILKLNPKKILEIGCGTGLLLSRLAPLVDLYVGTDISQKAISLISEQNLKNVRVFQCDALDFSPFKYERFDLVILNSVVQYFPGIEYLCEVLSKAESVLVPNGYIFLGDLRNLSLQENFHTSVILNQAHDTMTIQELKKQVERKKEQERELFIDPSFFQGNAFLQKGRFNNEMSLFRYNALLPMPLSIPNNLSRFANIPVNLQEQALLIKNALRKRLPGYMIPQHVVFLDQIPLTPNGKADRKLLPSPISQSITPTPSFLLREEELIADVWREALNIADVRQSDNFFDLGGHSLLAAQVTLKLSEKLKKQIPLRLLFQFPTLGEFALNIHTEQDRNRTWAKMLQDSFLPASITGKSSSSTAQAKILLTGATGFLGVFLLRDLLNTTTATIYCLVRGQDALLRLQKNAAYYRLILDYSRVQIIIGDLSKENLGLSQKEFAFHAQEIDVIYHCAAEVNFAASYESLRASNVLGTIEILRLATTHHTKPVHYISTLHILTQKDLNTPGIPYPRYGETLQMGYLQSKWTAERLMLSARERNVPVNIYRIGRIGGDTQTGACQRSDFYWGLVRACLKMRKVPDQGFDEQIIPIDIASKTILSQTLTLNRTFHIFNPTPLTTDDLITSFQQIGYPLTSCTVREWNEEIEKQLQKDPNDSATALAGFLSTHWGEDEPQFQAHPELEISSEWVQKTIHFFIETNFFPEKPL